MRHETKNSEPLPPMINVPFIKWSIIGFFFTPSLLNRKMSHYTQFFFWRHTLGLKMFKAFKIEMVIKIPFIPVNCLYLISITFPRCCTRCFCECSICSNWWYLVFKIIRKSWGIYVKEIIKDFRIYIGTPYNNLLYVMLEPWLSTDIITSGSHNKTSINFINRSNRRLLIKVSN